MLLASIVLATVLLVCGIVLFARSLEADSWRRSLVAFKLTAPALVTTDDVARWLVSVYAMTQADHMGPLPLVLLPSPPIALEAKASKNHIDFYVLLPETLREALEAGLRASLPGYGLEEAPEHLLHRPRFKPAAEAKISSHIRPLDHEHAPAASTARLSALHPLYDKEEVWMQWILTGGGISAVVRSVSGRRKGGGVVQLNDSVPPDPEAVHAARLKQQMPLLRASVRVGIANTPNLDRRYRLFGVVWAPFRVMNASGVGIVRRWLPSWIVADRLRRLALPLMRWPLTLNTSELAGLIGLAAGEAQLPGLASGATRPIPPTPDMPTDGTVVAMSDYHGMKDRPLTLRVADRLMHSITVGPTGTGKSTHLCGQALQDIAAGRATMYVDPKNDAVQTIVDRWPATRSLADLMVVDASDTALPIGFNPLAVEGDEHERELAVNRVLHVFHDIWAEFWGPRTDYVLRGALRTLAHTKAADGSAFTLCEVSPLLTNRRFREAVLQQPLPDYLRQFWSWYKKLRDSEQATVIGPVLNKLSTFTDTPALRLMLGQSRGLDLSAAIEGRNVVLLNLAKGRLGEETAPLLGALFVANLASAIYHRAYLPAEQRHEAMIYIDEFQDVLKMGAVNEVLAQGRGLGASFNLACQFLYQLPRATQHAVFGTVRTFAMFQLGHEDAKAFAPSVEPILTARDLRNLGARRIVLRPCVNGQTAAPVTGTTLALGEPTQDGQAIAQASRERYGVPRSQVEADLLARVQAAKTPQVFGRSPRTGVAA
jgi:hypothetical protein